MFLLAEAAASASYSHNRRPSRDLSEVSSSAVSVLTLEDTEVEEG